MSVPSADCPFCAKPDSECLIAERLVRAFPDGFPVSPGHALVVPRRHVGDWFDLTLDEQRDVLAIASALKEKLEAEIAPDGWNLGVNVGTAGGQTVPHVHLHLIPRWMGDVRDPRGGIRHVIPGKGNYLAASLPTTPHAAPLVVGSGGIEGGADDPLLPHLLAHLATATEVDIAVAFTMSSGVGLVEEHLRDVLARGGRVRILTGDYLGVTEPEALLRLRDLGERLELRVFESGGTSFHLKSYVCVDTKAHGTAFVGSSNLSKTALALGVEWNWRTVTSTDGAGFAAVRAAFEQLFADPRSVPATTEWIGAYRARRVPQRSLVDTTAAPEPPAPPAEPHGVQREALAALQATRADGNAAGLVVLATGLGKTWLAAFDSVQAGASRILFVAHREEILDQAMRTFRRVRPDAVLGKFTGKEKAIDADVTFASVQTLSRSVHLARFVPEAFDYVVMDEFHHASATTYRRVLDYFQPRFLLGLTATPERSDGGDLLALCGDNLVYTSDLAEGIRRGLLSPFDYFGVPDEVDYANIQWRNGRFDEEELSTRLAITSRADNALAQLRQRGGRKILAFCASQRHADFMHMHFSRAGLRSAAVHSGPSSAPRAASLQQLQTGELDVLCAVDMFNEGVDVPDIDTVLMLRPTESPVLFLQQLGRGLRWCEGKRLKVIDYIGNHRAFLVKPRALFRLEVRSDTQLAALLRLPDQRIAEQALPAECSITYDLEAKAFLAALAAARAQPSELLESYYRDFRERVGSRPTASESYHDGLKPQDARRDHGSWFQFVAAMGDLNAEEVEAENLLRPLLLALEEARMTKSFKMITLLAMAAEQQLPGKIPVERLMDRIRALTKRLPVARKEFGALLSDAAALRGHLEKHPIAAWTATPHFTYTRGVLATTLNVPEELRSAASRMLIEIAEWRLAQYFARPAVASSADRIVCKVSHAGARPILFLPPRDQLPGIPEGWVDITVDGAPHRANFRKVAVNVVQPAESKQNVLPDVLRGWYGAGAGQSGTRRQAVFERTPHGYVLQPAEGEESGEAE